MPPRRPAPIHGNYRGYYTKRLPFSSDPRLDAFDRDFFTGKRVLDVGCNEGFVTCELAQKWGASEVVGVDIDKDLVNLAMQRRRLLWSVQEPALHDDAQATVVRSAADSDGGQSNGAGVSRNRDYFPLSMPHMFGMLPLPNPPADSPRPLPFPYNVSFKTCDWINEHFVEDEQGWDIIIAFSITKWVHLNKGDEGIRKFFQKAHDVLRPGGMFVLEVQDWQGYAKARRMDERLKERAKTLELKPEMFDRVLLEEVGFESHRHLGVLGEGGFRRPIDVYLKSAD